jgi:hypothetical protein
LLDRYSIHTNPLLIDFDSSKNIELIFIPSEKTSIYQPFDVKNHGPLKSCAKKLCKEQYILSNNYELIKKKL